MGSTARTKTDADPDRWAAYSIGVNVVLLGLDLFVAAASGSLAVGTEVVHNGVDLLSAVGVLLGIKLAKRKSRAFPYGLYKLENVISVAIAGLNLVAAYEIARQAVFGAPRETVADAWMFVVLTAAVVIPAVFSHLELRVGRAAKSPALVADAKEYRVHVLTTGVALAALAGGSFQLRLDRWAALIIVIPVAKTGWDLLFDGMRVLLDASLEPKTLETIRRTALSDLAVVEIGSVTGRNAGRFRFVEIIVALRSNDLEKADQAAHRIEGRIREAVPNVERVLIHVDPKPRDRLQCAVPLADPKGTVADHFGGAPFFAFATVRTDDEEFEPAQIVPNPRREAERAKGIRVAEWLVERKTDVVVLRNAPGQEGPQYVFGNAGVTVHRTEADTLDRALAEVARVR